MQPDTLYWNDWMRILNGGFPWSFLFEVVLRGFFLYLLLFFSMRFMGRRMAAQLSRTEMAALVSLAATVGIPMQSPDKGLLPALVSAIVIVAFHSLITNITFKRPELEKYVIEEVEPLVTDGFLQLAMLKKNAISKELIFSQLRGSAIKNLGSVQRLYYEPTGAFTLHEFADGKPGLSLIPDWDKSMIDQEEKSLDIYACTQCGFTVQAGGINAINLNCSQCKSKDFAAATL